MAVSEARAKKNKVSADKGFGVTNIRVPCPGAGVEIKGEKGRKLTYYGVKYACSECGGLFARVRKGTYANGKSKWVMNKHTQKVETAKPFSKCAECNSNVYSIDFLCKSCRDIEGSY